MYPAALIAYAFVQKGIAERNYISQLKLQKMVYFAQGYHLSQFGKPLIIEDIEAWKFGPVVPDIYIQYSVFGPNPIVETDILAYDDNLRNKLKTLDEQARQAIEYTWEATRDVSARRLSEWTHEPDSPWQKYYYNDNGGRRKVIDNHDIQEFFKKFLSKDN
ncbi:Uncharacterized phage-associated protein [Chitinophaga costaii]|uniref:Uncharacterized phage-associated protein n=1 Tax=Chitinophaga costaii TaxID=1335309 RepID=A0A1C4BMC9_9BACT|nr:type II toxin-antitoxin system antitoxin SocA domain-containing protein [Chitinophaga costaii]PUZ27553.1 DUF4065 domain-containing protein [Chitinophaga costaii]SCC07908.1 Uncharacterized phage-associated protein [Chitinophaga costaii]